MNRYSQVVERLRAHGHDASLHPQSRVVLVRIGERSFRVVGGDFKHPSLLEARET